MSPTHRVPSSAIVAGVSAICLLLVAGCSNTADPFSYVKVSGTVTYEDGSKIPAPVVELNFIPETKVVGKATPRVGTAFVDPKTGEFKNVTSHKPNDGLVHGKYKVIVAGPDHAQLPTNIVPAEYGDFQKTPLEVDTDHLPFEIKVPKP
ncbi:MAG: hypothetical protein ABSG53_02935 [Thermoguttaceae bacterium]|jgi:hypothetical protein